MESKRPKSSFVFFIILPFIVWIVFTYQHWAEFQKEFSVANDTSAIIKIFASHYLMIGLIRSFSILLVLLFLFGLCIMLYKFYFATEVKTKLIEFSTESKELESLGKNLEKIKDNLEQQKFESLVKDIVQSIEKKE